MTNAAKIRSVLKYRSAICPAIKGAATAPIEPANPRIIPISDPEKPRPPSATPAERYLAVTGSHAPQRAYCKNIIVPRRLFLLIKGPPCLKV